MWFRSVYIGWIQQGARFEGLLTETRPHLKKRAEPLHYNEESIKTNSNVAKFSIDRIISAHIVIVQQVTYNSFSNILTLYWTYQLYRYIYMYIHVLILT